MKNVKIYRRRGALVKIDDCAEPISLRGRFVKILVAFIFQTQIPSFKSSEIQPEHIINFKNQ